MLGIQPKFQTCEKQKNRENKTPKLKQSHTKDSIYVVRQFAYDHRVAGISLLSKKITMCGYNVFLSQKQQDKTLITKKNGQQECSLFDSSQASSTKMQNFASPIFSRITFRTLLAKICKISF